VPDRYAVWLDRDTVTASGPEAASFLQGQLSQDVEALGAEESAWSWVLSPQGKIDALVRVTHLSDEDWVIDTDRGWGEPLLQRLNRFKLRTKVEFAAVPWKVLGLRGPGSTGPAVDGARVTVTAWPGIEGVDAIGPHLSPPEGWQLIEGWDYESVRILSGMPKMGAELDDRTIPAETGIVPLTVSFTKGCYTGQELVARVDSRGSNVPRRLRLMRLSGPLPAGTELQAEGAPAGTVTSVAQEAGGGWVALGYTKRGVDVPASLVASPPGPDAGPVAVAVEELGV
jgi:folate-binding protein YgfZ